MKVDFWSIVKYSRCLWQECIESFLKYINITIYERHNMNKEQLEKILKQTTPHYFGLGFIQCKINNYERIHVYHPDLMPIVNIEEEIHNHRYDFSSTILSGSIINKKYDFNEYGHITHFLQNETCNKDIKTDNTKRLYGTIKLISENLLTQGETYFMHFNQFHTFQTEKCITYLKRSDYKQELAQVVRPLNGDVVCPFSKEMSVEQCWDIINDCLKNF